MNNNDFSAYTPAANKAIGKAIAEIEVRVNALPSKHRVVNRDSVRVIAREVLAPVFAKHRAAGVTDTEVRCAISDELDRMLEGHGRPQPGWESYDLV